MRKKITIEELYAQEILNQNNWRDISALRKYELSDEVINEFIDKFDWSLICKYRCLTEQFIRKYQKKVSWMHVSKYQRLSEEFIEEFKDKVDWYQIGSRQKLSYEFIIKHLFNSELDSECIFANRKINNYTKKQLQAYLNAMIKYN